MVSTYQRNSVLGLYSTSDVAKMLAEIAKMEDLRHPNVISLIGVHLDIRLGLSIVMPFMANGSLLEYLKRERSSIYLDDSADVDTVSELRKLPGYPCSCSKFNNYLHTCRYCQ
jgi:serine/threonine protein kinase